MHHCMRRTPVLTQISICVPWYFSFCKESCFIMPETTSLYKMYHNVGPIVGIGTLPTPLSPASVPLPPEPGGRGHTRLRVRGWGSPSSDDWRKSLALCLLCALDLFYI